MTTPTRQHNLAAVRKYVDEAMMQIDLMRTALRRVDRDFEQCGMITCETIEFCRTVQRVIA